MIIKINCKKKHFIKALSLIVVACLLSVTNIDAQDEPEPVGDGLDGETTTVPFDNGVGLLVAVAILYGARKAYDAKKSITGDHSEAAP